RSQVVEEREILVHGLDAEPAGVGGRVQCHAAAVHLDRAAVERERAAQRLDQRRLAGAVVAEKREHLAGAHVEVDLVEPDDGAVALRRALHGQHRRHPSALIARATRTRVSMRPRITSPSTASRTTTPIVNAPTRALPTLPRPPANAAPPMITAAIESSSARSPAVGEPASMRPAVSNPPTPAARPLRTYTATSTRPTGIPARRAASGFPPTAYSQRPQTR